MGWLKIGFWSLSLASLAACVALLSIFLTVEVGESEESYRYLLVICALLAVVPVTALLAGIFGALDLTIGVRTMVRWVFISTWLCVPAVGIGGIFVGDRRSDGDTQRVLILAATYAVGYLTSWVLVWVSRRRAFSQ